MKPMNQRSMDMGAGKPKSSAYFPEEAHVKELRRVGEVAGHQYPDREQDIYADQEQFKSSASRGKAKDGFRH